MSESSASDGGGAVDHANALRPRYQGSCADLTKVLMPFVAAKTNFIIYSEEEKPSKAKLNKKNVASHYPLLEALRSIQPNLCFSKKLLERSVLAAHDQAKLGLKGKDRDDYGQTMTRRLRNMMRAVSQGIRKSPSAAWVRELPWIGAAAPTSGPPMPSFSPTEAPAFMYGYDAEQRLAWRVRFGTTEKELAVSMFARDAAAPTDAIVAKFSDGAEHEVSDLSVAEWQVLTKARASSSAGVERPVMFEAEHAQTRHKLTVKERTDRGQLVSLFEQGAQVCQFKVTSFGPDDKDPATLKAATDAMITIAKRYASNEIDKSQLYIARNEILANLEKKKTATAKTARSKATAKSKTTAKATRRDVPNAAVTNADADSAETGSACVAGKRTRFGSKRPEKITEREDIADQAAAEESPRATEATTNHFPLTDPSTDPTTLPPTTPPTRPPLSLYTRRRRLSTTSGSPSTRRAILPSRWARKSTYGPWMSKPRGSR